MRIGEEAWAVADKDGDVGGDDDGWDTIALVTFDTATEAIDSVRWFDRVRPLHGPHRVVRVRLVEITGDDGG